MSPNKCGPSHDHDDAVVRDKKRLERRLGEWSCERAEVHGRLFPPAFRNCYHLTVAALAYTHSRSTGFGIPLDETAGRGETCGGVMMWYGGKGQVRRERGSDAG